MYSSTLIFQIKRIISSEKKSNHVVPFLFFFFENAKNLGRSDDGKQRKKKRMDSTGLCQGWSSETT